MNSIKTKLRLSDGMTLVELMVAVGITAILMTLSITIFNRQHKSYSTIQDANEVQETLPTAMEILQRELMQAGWSVLPNMAFYFDDGGDNGSDTIYMNDMYIIDIIERNDNATGSTDYYLKKDLSLWIMSKCPGCQKINSPSTPSNSFTLDAANLDINSPEGQDFYGGRHQAVITDETADPTLKVAEISAANAGAKTITLDKNVQGDYIAPAIYYEIDGDTLRRSDRHSTPGPYPLADHIVDLQVAYEDSSGLHCNDNSSCPATPFDPSDITKIQLAFVSRNDQRDPSLAHKKDYCRPSVFNRSGATPSANPDECGYTYRTYTIEFAVRNNS